MADLEIFKRDDDDDEVEEIEGTEVEESEGLDKKVIIVRAIVAGVRAAAEYLDTVLKK